MPEHLVEQLFGKNNLNEIQISPPSMPRSSLHWRTLPMLIHTTLPESQIHVSIVTLATHAFPCIGGTNRDIRIFFYCIALSL